MTMDQNAIRLTKSNYRKCLLAHKSINLMDAVCLLHNAWQKVTMNTLEKCWHKVLSGNLSDDDPNNLKPQLSRYFKHADTNRW